MGRSTAILVLVLALSGTALAVNEEFFVPQWRVGDRWLVKTERTSLAARNVAQETGTSSLWIFKVVGLRDELVQGRDVRFIHIMARNWKTPPAEEAGLLFAGRLNATRNRVIALSLVRAAFRQQDGTTVERFYNKNSPGPHPVIGDASPIPTSFPLFLDGGLVGRRTGGGSTVELGRVFPVTEQIGTLPFARDVIQQVDVPVTVDPGAVRTVVSADDLRQACQVTITRPDDNARVVQVWHRSQPWFVYDETGTSRSWLVRVHPAED